MSRRERSLTAAAFRRGFQDPRGQMTRRVCKQKVHGVTPPFRIEGVQIQKRRRRRRKGIRRLEGRRRRVASGCGSGVQGRTTDTAASTNHLWVQQELAPVKVARGETGHGGRSVGDDRQDGQDGRDKAVNVRGSPRLLLLLILLMLLLVLLQMLLWNQGLLLGLLGLCFGSNRPDAACVVVVVVVAFDAASHASLTQSCGVHSRVHPLGVTCLVIAFVPCVTGTRTHDTQK